MAEKLYAEKERDRFARQREKEEKTKRLMEKVNKLMDEAEGEVKNAGED